MAAEPAVQHDHLPIMAIHTAAALASIAGSRRDRNDEREGARGKADDQ